MNALTIALIAILAVGIAVGAYALVAPRKRAEVHESQTAAPALDEPAAEIRAESSAWTTEAGQEFSGLSESARCDLIFAVSDLDDDRSRALLLHALEDPSDAVALAAAHALARRGCEEDVKACIARGAQPRAQRIVETLALLDGGISAKLP